MLVLQWTLALLTHIRRGKRLGHVEDGGRRHAVELADLRGSLQHLDAVLVCEHGKHEGRVESHVWAECANQLEVAGISPSDTSYCEQAGNTQ